MITIHQVLTDAVSILKEHNINTPRLDGEVILAHLLDLSLIHIFLSNYIA